MHSFTPVQASEEMKQDPAAIKNLLRTSVRACPVSTEYADKLAVYLTEENLIEQAQSVYVVWAPPHHLDMRSS